jgi:hypothetical protein
MEQTVVGVFDSHVDAMRAQRALVAAGFEQASSCIYSTAIPRTTRHGPRVYGHSPHDVDPDNRVLEQLERLFARLFAQGEYPPETDHYREFIRRGGSILSLDVSNEQAEMARDAMIRAGSVDIDERVEPRQREGHQAAGWDGPVRRGAIEESPGAARAAHCFSSNRANEVDFADSDDEFRNAYDNRYAAVDLPYEDPERGHSHRDMLGRDERYQKDDWPQVEPHVPEHSETPYPENGWARVKTAVRHGWGRVTGRHH